MKTCLKILLFLLISKYSIGQEVWVRKADSLIKVGKYEEAAVMFEKANYLSSSTEAKACLLMQKAQCLKEGQKINDAFYTLERINKNALEDSLKMKLFIEKALLSFLKQDYLVCENYLFQYEQICESNKNKDFNLLNVLLCNANEDYDQSLVYYNKFCKLSELEMNGDSLYSSFLDEKRKSMKLAKILSLVLPGSGQVYTGNYLTGVTNTLIVSGLMTYLVFNFTTYQYGSASIATGLLFQVWIGGSKNATKLADDYNKKLIFNFNKKIIVVR